jgi:hypothetical protein
LLPNQSNAGRRTSEAMVNIDTLTAETTPIERRGG